MFSRKRIWVMLVAALICFVLPASIAAAPPGSESGTAGAPPAWGAPTTVRAPAGLRLRLGPSLTDSIVLVLYNGETVYPSSVVWNQGISWTYVRAYRGGYYYEGFCATAYLGSYGGYVEPGGSGMKVVAPAGLRLRSGPSLGYGIRRIVPYGTVLQPAGSTQWGSGLQWTQLWLDGSTVWGASQYLVAQ